MSDRATTVRAESVPGRFGLQAPTIPGIADRHPNAVHRMVLVIWSSHIGIATFMRAVDGGRAGAERLTWAPADGRKDLSSGPTPTAGRLFGTHPSAGAGRPLRPTDLSPRRGIGRRSFLRGAGVAGMSALLAACSIPGIRVTGFEPGQDESDDKTLDWANWPLYIDVPEGREQRSHHARRVPEADRHHRHIHRGRQRQRRVLRQDPAPTDRRRHDCR